MHFAIYSKDIRAKSKDLSLPIGDLVIMNSSAITIQKHFRALMMVKMQSNKLALIPHSLFVEVKAIRGLNRNGK